MNLYRRGRAFLAESIAQHHTMEETGRIMGSQRDPNKPICKQRVSQLVRLAYRIRMYEEARFIEEITRKGLNS